jgi:Cft2 family RNA processing exonuclease
VPDESWDYGTIYTSPVSKKLLLLRFPHLAPYVQELALYTAHQIKSRSVTLYEANHCPGAVMFLFQGTPTAVPTNLQDKQSFRFTVLHTGDFRFKHSMLDHFKLKKEEANDKTEELKSSQEEE